MYLRSISIGILLFLASVLPGRAQFFQKIFKEIEFFGGVGTTSYFGDVGGKDDQVRGIQTFFDNLDIDLWQVRGMFNVGVRVCPVKKVGLTVQLSPIFLSGNDLRSNYTARGYAFKTAVVETSLQCEYYLVNRPDIYSPYGTIGFSGLFYTYKNNVTELQSKWYSGNSYIFGAGVRFPTSTTIAQSLDFSFHFTSTDNLEGLKTDRNSKDLFFVLSYKVNFLYTIRWY